MRSAKAHYVFQRVIERPRFWQALGGSLHPDRGGRLGDRSLSGIAVALRAVTAPASGSGRSGRS